MTAEELRQVTGRGKWLQRQAATSRMVLIVVAVALGILMSFEYVAQIRGVAEQRERFERMLGEAVARQKSMEARSIRMEEQGQRVEELLSYLAGPRAVR